jgi:hypothetical protein
MISSGEIERAKALLVNELPDIYKQSVKVRALIDALQFIAYIDNKDIQGAIEFS